MKINFVKRFCLGFVFASLTMLCHAEEIGLVLSGGGGKGAYEVGVWKALCEYGIAQKVTVISGTSVGGLNAALFACVKADKAEKIWVDIVPSRLTQDGALISQEGLNKIISSIPLQKLNKGYRPHVFVTTVRAKGKIIKRFTSKPGSDAFRFLLNEEPDFEQIRLKLLATSAFPVLTDPITLADGYKYTDGGEEAVGGDNVPLAPIVERYPDIKNIFVIYLSDRDHVKRRIQKKDFDTKVITEIFPSIDTDGSGFWERMLDGTANFKEDRIKLLIRQGYEDTVELLQRRGMYPVSSYWYE